MMLIGLAMIAATAPDPCKRDDTIGMAECMDGKIEQATKRLNRYRGAAHYRFTEPGDGFDPITAKALENAATVADAYRKAYCDAVYQHWVGGTIRYAMRQSCELQMIDRQTYDVWRDFLNPMQADSILPEPKPTP